MCTARDLHFGAPRPTDYRLLLFVGHHEYWTAEMRTSVETFARSGGNVAFFAGNTCWWQVRLSADGSQMICYKVAGLDPVSTTADHSQTTVHWFDDLVKRPETTLTGVSWQGEGVYYDADHRFLVKRADHWVFAGTGLGNGAMFGGYSSIPGGPVDSSVVGPESDKVQDGGPNGLTSPADFVTLADVIYPTPPDAYEEGAMGIFQATKDSGYVFNAPTINWALGLSQDAGTSNIIDQITYNVIANLGPPRPQWTSVSQGGTTPGAPVTALMTGPNQVTLFAADSGGGVYTATGSPGTGWGPWTSVSQGGTTPGAPIVAVLTGPNQVTLFAADPGGGVYTASGSPGTGWGPWTSVSQGSTTPGAPIAAVLTGPNQVTLILADPGGGIYAASGSAATGWGPWMSVSQGSSTPGAPVTALVSGSNRVTLFVADAGGGVYTASGSASGGWGPWSSVSQGGTTPGGRISAVLTSANLISLFLADPDGGVYTATGSPDAGWGPWTSVFQGTTTPVRRSRRWPLVQTALHCSWPMLPAAST